MKTIDIILLEDIDIGKKGEKITTTKTAGEELIKKGLAEAIKKNKKEAKAILDKYATYVIRKNAIWKNKDGKAQVDQNKGEDYDPKRYKDDIVLWIAPKDSLVIEFEGTQNQNKRWIREIESAAKSLGFDYCITEHEGGKSQYFRIFNIKGLPLNYDNKLAKDLLIDLLLPSGAKKYLDKTNLGHTLSPAIGHQHWKPKYNCAIHKIIRGTSPLDQKNTYPKELLKNIKKAKQKTKSNLLKLRRAGDNVSDGFLLDYSCNNKLPGGQRHNVVEKNLAAKIYHRDDREEILEKYLKVQGRETNTLRTWFNAISNGLYSEVSPGELIKYINDNDIPYILPAFSNEPKQPTEITKEEKKILEDSNLLLWIIKHTQTEKNLIGEEDTVLVLTNKLSLRLVKNVSATSGNFLVSDDTGGGKDVTTKAVCETLVPQSKLFHRTHLSEKALNYWDTNKQDGFTWDKCVLYLEDPEEDLIKSQTFKVMSSGGNKTSVVKDQTLIEQDIPGKPVIVVTSLKASIDEEGGRRWDSKRVDTSVILTKLIIKKKMLRSMGVGEKNVDTLVSDALHKLKPYEVIIPFADKLLEIFSVDNLVMRTQVDKIIDYIKSSAVLHQYQREKDEFGRVKATWFDYDYSRFVFLALKDIEGQPLNKAEEELIDILKSAGKPLSIKEASENFSHTKQWIYNHIDNLKSKKLIREVLEENKEANKEIMKITYGNNFIDNENVLPKSLVLNGFKQPVENQNKEGFNGFNSFNNICERIDKKREKDGLLPLFKNILNVSQKTIENHESVENLPVGGFKQPVENQLKPKDNDIDPSKYSLTLKHVEGVLTDQPIKIIELGKRLNKDNIGDINHIQGIVEAAINDPDFSTLIKRNDKGYFKEVS